MSDCAPSKPSELARSVAGRSSSPSPCSAATGHRWRNASADGNRKSCAHCGLVKHWGVMARCWHYDKPPNDPDQRPARKTMRPIMTAQEAITKLRSMQSQIIHGSNVFGEIADRIELMQSGQLAWKSSGAICPRCGNWRAGHATGASDICVCT